jgi:hypothetical protein
VRPITVLLWAAVAAAAWAGQLPAWAGELRAGAAAVTITPPPGIPMAGYYSLRGAQEVHDDLQAKAIVLESEGKSAGLVALDLISTPRDLVEDSRREIDKLCHLRGTDVMITATHTHTGPVVDAKSNFGGSSDRVKRYRAGLPALIARAVQQAESRLVPAKTFVARGREESIAFNRRYHMKDGTVGWNPGKGNPNILKPAGPIDPDVPIVFFQSTDRKPLATYVNYAVHLDNIGQPMVSADMPCTLSRALADFQGPEMVTLFSAGCCGDVNHIDVHWPEAQRGFANAARMGTILAAEVLRNWPRLTPVESTRVQVKSATVSLSLPEIAPGDVPKARAIVARLKDSTSKRPAFLELVWAFKVLDVAARERRPLEVEVQVVALGNEVAWVSLPGEIFAELGLAIKQDSPFANTIIAELANGSIGYIPARRAYDQGNYEVVSARCAEGSGEKLVDAAIRLLKELRAVGPQGSQTGNGSGARQQ